MPKQEKVKINVKDRLEDNAIDLSLSELTEVPVKDIAALRRATILDLSNNKLISLGKNFTSLTHITKLDLSKNQIRFLPEDFGSLKSLRHLDLFNNRLEHLPLSFGNLSNLKYLDLKSNPLTPALAKIVGPCLTSKDCIESAKNTVKFLARMQKEVELAKEKLQQESEAQIDEIEEVTKKETQKAKKSKKKNKNKRKSDSTSEKGGRTRENGNAGNYLNGDSDVNMKKSNSVLKTIATFTFLLILNILMLYIITVKHPEIADKLVAMIPPRYQELIVTKSEDLRLNFLQISDWLQKFITPPS